MSLRVSGSSSTTSTFSFVSYCTAPVGAPDDPAWLGSVFVVPAESVGEMSAPSIENVCGFGICDRWRPLTVSNECSTDGCGRSGCGGVSSGEEWCASVPVDGSPIVLVGGPSVGFVEISTMPPVAHS